MKLGARFLFLTVILFVSWSCGNEPKETADLILDNGNVYTVDESQPLAEAVAVKGDRILAVGSSAEMEAFRTPETEVVDLEGQFVMPGFIEGHGHFWGIGQGLMTLNFMSTKSWDEVVSMVAEKAARAEPGEWIIGRGWHQEKWIETPTPQVLGYPYHYDLSAVSPDNPVMLRHASGHSLFANARAMELAGITGETPDPAGGEIVRDAQGEAVGVFEERAMGLVAQAYQEYVDGFSKEQLQAYWREAMTLAQAECLSKGITSFQDAGSGSAQFESAETIAMWKEMAENGELDLRIWAMIRHKNHDLREKIDGLPFDLPVVGAGNHYFTCRAIKSELDGALGAYGAWLLSPYEDKPGFTGQNTTPVEDVAAIAEYAVANGLQLCVHAIGDRANRETLNVFEEAFRGAPGQEDLRWRIEHSQHLDTADIPRFSGLGVIASMQAIHCTSDAPFVVKRLGEERARYGAYPWRSLLDSGAVVTNGTDAPVEDVDPIASFYASVTRRRPDSDLVFFPEQGMTRAEALHSYTLANAYAAFEEDLKGSLSPGKLADIVVLSKDLINCPEEEILDAEVMLTLVGGEVKYRKEK